MTTLLAIDIGTTEIKFKVYNERASLLAFSRPVTTYYEGPAVYQKPQEILAHVQTGIKECLKEVPGLRQIIFSTAMHSLIPLVEPHGATRMYLWSDNQAAEVIETFKQSELAENFYRKTGTPIHAMSPFAKLLYFKQIEPSFFKSVSQWQDLKSYLFQALTGQRVLDYSVASATGLFNSLTFEWDKEILAYLDLTATQLPTLVTSETSFPLTDETLMVEQPIEVILGGSDGCLAAFASFYKGNSPYNLTLGTSGAVRMVTTERRVDFSSQQFCYFLADDLWVIGGATNNGGKVLEWLQQSFLANQVDVFDKLPALLSKIDYQAEVSELIFLPFLQGERAPIWNSHARGSFANLSIQHSLDDLILAVVEGIIYNLKLIFDRCHFEAEESPIILNGGVFKTAVISQLVADVFQQQVILQGEVEPSDGLHIMMSQPTLKTSSQSFSPNPAAKGYHESRFKKFKKAIKQQGY